MTDDDFVRIALADSRRRHHLDEDDLPHHERLRRRFDRERATAECADAVPTLLAEIERLHKERAIQGGSPLTPEREAEIREGARKAGVLSDAHAHSLLHQRRDLLAVLDWERRQRLAEASVCQDYLSEPPATAGERLGVAKALAVLWRLLKEADAQVKDAPNNSEQRMWGDRWNALSSAVGQVESECGPALLPPHERTHARLLRLEAALERIARGDGDGDDVTWQQSSLMWQRVAREALGEGKE